jgi:formamidopyrimidine-DNA glycosylase
MPELPEVETTRRLLEPIMVGRRVRSVEVGHPRAVRHQANPADFAARLTGRRILGVGRRGKYLLTKLDGDLIWVLHLGMSGRVEVHPVEVTRPRHCRVAIGLSSGAEVRFIDPRTFGHTAVFSPAELDETGIARLGPDALLALPRSPVLAGSLQGRRAPIKALLLDQRIIAGVGNIYADEALHRARISPHRAGGSLDRDDVGRLRRAITVTLHAGLAAGGTSLNDMAYLLPDGRAGEFQVRLRAYGREGKPCRRGDGTIRRDVVGGRSSFWCPACQH